MVRANYTLFGASLKISLQNFEKIYLINPCCVFCAVFRVGLAQILGVGYSVLANPSAHTLHSGQTCLRGGKTTDTATL